MLHTIFLRYWHRIYIRIPFCLVIIFERAQHRFTEYSTCSGILISVFMPIFELVPLLVPIPTLERSRSNVGSGFIS